MNEPIVDRQNVYPAKQTPSPYFTFPSWFRRFIFQILERRDLAVYFYLCSMCNPQSVAYPLRSQMMHELGLKSRTALNESLEKLEQYGFLISKKLSVTRAETTRIRTVFQRPAIEYTLLQLIEKEIVNEKLLPPGHASPQSDRALKIGLISLTSDEYGVVKYLNAPDRETQKALLRTLLTESMSARREMVM